MTFSLRRIRSHCKAWERYSRRRTTSGWDAGSEVDGVTTVAWTRCWQSRGGWINGTWGIGLTRGYEGVGCFQAAGG